MIASAVRDFKSRVFPIIRVLWIFCYYLTARSLDGISKPVDPFFSLPMTWVVIFSDKGHYL